jgi:hypothetical protein
VLSIKLRIYGSLAILAAITVGLAEAQSTSSSGFILPTLKEQLTDGLRARIPSEQAFIEEVVALVNSGDLPLSMVQSTFLWARKKPRYQMPYFQAALTARAKEIGVKL